MENKTTILDQLDQDVLETVAAQDPQEAGLSFAAKAAMASVPVALGLMSRQAFGQSLPQQIKDVLNFALTLEYLEEAFYQMGVGKASLIPANVKPVFEQILKHESAHVALLKSVLGADAVAKPAFDFTAKGAFNPFNDYATFLILSQGFEDTGVRAYKGQAGNLMSNDMILTVALQIHSVEARHAAEVRRIRGPGNAKPDAWIEFAMTNAAPIQAVYNGEDNIMQGGVDVSTVTDRPVEAITEAFDEPLSKEAVLAIAGMFLA